MTVRLDAQQAAPGVYEAMLGLERYTVANVEASLLELVKLRASYINNCAFCLDMHTTDALKAGENVQRLFLVSAWREAEDFFTERERAALALTDAVTRIADEGVPDEVWRNAAARFGEKELADLTAAIVTINGWNRLAITMGGRIPRRA